jgi:hypothetical protein
MTQWYELSSEGRDLWQSLPEADKAIILGSTRKGTSSAPHRVPRPTQSSARPRGGSAPNKKLSSYLTEIAIKDNDPALPPDDTTVSHDPTLTDSDHVLLANATKQKRTWTQPRGSDLPPPDIRKVLSTENTRKEPQSDHQTAKEIVVHGTRYRAVNAACIYSVSSTHRTTVSGSLIDRGTNGGIAGDDVRILETTLRTVDVRGINNHEVTGIPIVTAAGVVTTQHGPVIAIMPQYAYLRSGKTIHSAAQLEHYQNVVNDRSIKVQGGLQRILTLDGYVIPINIVDGLPYISLRPYDDDEWDKLPHIILTSNLDWDPSILDHTLFADDEHWYDAVCDLDERPYDSKFDSVGNYLGCVIVQTSLSTALSDSSSSLAGNQDTLSTLDIDDLIDRCTSTTSGARLGSSAHVHQRAYQADSTFTVVSQPSPCTVTPTEPDYDAICPYFGWLPLDIIKETFAWTTQYARMPMSTYLKR